MRAASPASRTRTRTISRPRATNSVELSVVEPRDVEVRVAGEAELAAAVVDLGAPVAGHPEVVARRDGIVDADRHPVVGALLRRQIELPGEIGDAADDARELVVGARDIGLGRDKQRENPRDQA